MSLNKLLNLTYQIVIVIILHHSNQKVKRKVKRIKVKNLLILVKLLLREL